MMWRIIFFSCTWFIQLMQCFEGNYIIDNYERGGADLAYLGSSIFGEPSPDTGKKMENWDETFEINPEELGEYAEGDILFPNDLSRNGLISETARWPRAQVPYDIKGYFNRKERDLIKQAMEQYHKYTCVRFRPRKSSDPDWISITSDNTGCWSSVGRTGRSQSVNLQSPGCLSKIGTVLHELLHAIGFQHEQNRWERDSYVAVHWGNIPKDKEGNFKKSSKNQITGFGVPYDYGSVMHYSGKAFSKNGKHTITVLKDSKTKIGQRDGFSKKDIQKINLMYKCPTTKENRYETENSVDETDVNHRDLSIFELTSVQSNQ